MKRLFVKLLSLTAISLMCVLLLCACFTEEVKEFNVAIGLPEGVTVKGDNPVTVKKGGTATFEIVIPEGYVFKSCEGATFDQETGILTVNNVISKMYLEFKVEKFTHDVSERFAYQFVGASKLDTSSVPNGSVSSGTLITLKAGDSGRAFIGWTIGAPYSSGAQVVSTEREFSIRISPDNVTDGALIVYSNYVDTDTVIYHANGGKINTGTDNMTHKEFYTVKAGSETVELTYGAQYLSFMECASAFYDDGTFTRDGYVLIEYNTKADGSGESYSLGSKVPMLSADLTPTELYCVWAKDSAHTDFTYENIHIPYPFSKTATAPHWVEDGIVITSYTGGDSMVVVPEKIDGKTVVAIGAGAFTDRGAMTTLVLNRRIIKVADGAFVGCSALKTVYYPDSIYEMNNEALDDASYTSLKNIYVNATLAPRYVGCDTGALSVKLSRLLASEAQNRIILIAGSSAYQGFGTEYMEALFEGEYRVINFGTTRTTNGIMYLEAMQALAHEGDIVIYAPENSSYMFGETELYWKTMRDLENMNNIYRYVDFSNYTNVFGSFTDFNKSYRYNESGGASTPRRYEQICVNGSLSDTSDGYRSPTTNKYGDYLYYQRSGVSSRYNDAYFITMNERIKSKYEGAWNDTNNQHANKDYTDPSNETWCSFTDSYYADQMNRAIDLAKSGGAKVYFAFCPSDANALVDGADTYGALRAYDELISATYHFDGLVGRAENYVFDHGYFYDCAFHLNDTGRTYRTYRMYLDLATILGITDPNGYKSVGTDFDGCTFENTDGTPLVNWTPSN